MGSLSHWRHASIRLDYYCRIRKIMSVSKQVKITVFSKKKMVQQGAMVCHDTAKVSFRRYMGPETLFSKKYFWREPSKRGKAFSMSLFGLFGSSRLLGPQQVKFFSRKILMLYCLGCHAFLGFCEQPRGAGGFCR